MAKKCPLSPCLTSIDSTRGQTSVSFRLSELVIRGTVARFPLVSSGMKEFGTWWWKNVLLLFQMKKKKKRKKKLRETDENGWTFQKFKSDDLHAIDVS